MTLLEALFPGTVGQNNLKREIFETYAGAKAAGLPLPHALLLSPPGYGKSECFAPAIATLTGHHTIGPYSVSLNMKVDNLIEEIALGFAEAEAKGLTPMIILEELGNLGKQNAGRFLTFLTEGVFTTLTGDRWDAGKPGRDWFLVAAANDDGNLLPALRSRLITLRFDPYTVEDLAVIGWDYATTNGYDADQEELLILAERVASPREMLQKTARMVALHALGQKSTAEDVALSLRVDANGLHADTQRALVTLLDMGGRAGMMMLSKALHARTSTVQGWVGELMEAGFVHPPKSGNGGGTCLTFEGQRKAATLKYAA